MRKYLVMLMLVLVTLMVGCSETKKAEEKTTSKTPKTMVIVSGNSGGAWYYLASGQAQILTEKMGGISFSNEASSAAPIQNMPFVSDDANASTMSMMTLDGFVAGLKGDERFGFDPKKPIKNVQFIQAGNTTTTYGITLAKTGIKDISELKGKKIAVPTVGNSAYYLVLGILAEYGVTPQNTKMTPMLYNEAGDALKDEQFDAIWINGGIPMAAATDLDLTKQIRFLSPTKEIAEKLRKENPYWAVKTVPKGTYKNAPEDFLALGLYSTLAVRADLSNDVVYKMTKTLNEETDRLSKIHPDGRFWNANTSEEVMKLNIVPVHPGAKKYYDELKAKK